MPQTAPSAPSVRRRRVTFAAVAQLAAILASGYGGAMVFFYGYRPAAWFFVGLGACCLAAFVFGWGYSVPCVVLGLLLGAFLDLRVKGGTAESQMWETVTSVAICTAIGLIVGVAADLARPGKARGTA